MSRSTINTGHTTFGEAQTQQTISQGTMRIAILGDFSGRQSQGICEPETIAQRPPIRITKDNFERVFESLNIRLQLPTCKEPLCFTEYDDLHPDFLYKRLPLFAQFKKLNKQLLTPDQLSMAASEIQQWASFKAQNPLLTKSTHDITQTAKTNTSDSLEGDYDSMLDALLAESQSQGQRQHHYQASPDGQIDQLIKDIISPYISPKADPRQGELLDAVEAASGEAMRKLLHHSDFQQLEASWRSLHFLIKRLDSHAGLSLEIIDISKEELIADLAQADSDLEQASIFKLLVAQQAHAGQTPFHSIVGDFYIEACETDMGLVIDMPTIAQSVNATFIAGAKESLAGCQSLSEADNPNNWQTSAEQGLADAWQAIREFDASESCLLSAPRFLLRTPYGQQSTTIDNFSFEELPNEHAHEFYLWGNSAYLQVFRIAQQFIATDSTHTVQSLPPIEVDQLPLHVYKQDGETQVKPCAEINMTDSTAAALTKAGISIVRSVMNQDKVIISQPQLLAGQSKNSLQDELESAY